MRISLNTGIALVALFFTCSAHAQVPQVINYQGRVVVGAANFNGSGQFKFALVNSDGSTSYWSNDGSSAAGSQPTNGITLTVSQGLYSVQLGNTSLANMTAIPYSVFQNSTVMLRVWFNDGTHGYELLSPDQRVTAVGYSMVAASVPNGTITAAEMAGGAAAANLSGGGGTLNLSGYTLSIPLSGLEAPTVSGGETLPLLFGTTTTEYAGVGLGPLSMSLCATDSTDNVSGGGPGLVMVQDDIPPDSAGALYLGVQSAMFLHAGGNTVTAPGNVNAEGYRATITNRGTGNVFQITGFNTHIGDQTSGYGGGGSVAEIVGFNAGTPVADANSPIATAVGVNIEPQAVTGVTTAIGIDQQGYSDMNEFNGPFTIGSAFMHFTGGGIKIGEFPSDKFAFWGSTPIAQPSGDVLTALANMGLVSGPTLNLGGNAINPVIASSSSTVSNNASTTFITNGGNRGNAVIPANLFVVGSTYRLRMAGTYSTTGTPTLSTTLGTYSNGLGTTFATTGPQTVGTNASNLEWSSEYTFTVQSTGASGTLIGQGWSDFQLSGGSPSVRYAMPNTSTVAINTTTTQWLMGFVTWGTAAPGNSITCTNWTVEKIY